MTLLFRISVVYFLLATLALVLLGEDLGYLATKIYISLISVRGAFTNPVILPVTVMAVVILWRMSTSRGTLARQVAHAVLTLAICCIFLAAFSTVKTAMPEAARQLGLPEFFADPFFAELDRQLFFGTDPWRPVHALTQSLGLTDFASQSSVIYGLVWIVPAFYLPAVMVLIGEREERVRHFVMLYAFAWIVLGNLVAFAGLSAGPVFYDRVFGTERFAELHVALDAGGLATSWFGRIQPNLWAAYAEGENMVGSGISAFPSLHIATIFVAALYLNEKHWTLGLIGWLMTAAMLFISVWIGYHYLIDGVFSIVAVFAAHLVLKRSVAASRSDAALAPVAAE